MPKAQSTLRDRLAAALAGLVFPASCPLCGRRPESFELSPICASCWQDVAPYPGHCCAVCSKPLVSEDATVCGECLSHEPPFSRAMSYALYEGTLKEAIHLMKFSSIKRLARPLGRLLSELPLPEAQHVVPVPLSRRGLLRRGFNQSLLIAHAVARSTGVELCEGILYKQKDTLPQVGLSRTERLKNLKGAFALRRRLNGGRVLLVDDVITTGATIRECSKVLVRGGAEEVVAVSLARSHSPLPSVAPSPQS